MKYLIITIVATLLAVTNIPANAKTEQIQKMNTGNQKVQQKSNQTPVYEQKQVDQKAMFTGGEEKLMEFMLKNMKYPKDAEREKVGGTVCVHFIVKSDGCLAEIQVPASVHPALDAEGIRIVKAMPKWIPAKKNGKPVNQKAMIAIPFRLK